MTGSMSSMLNASSFSPEIPGVPGAGAAGGRQADHFLDVLKEAASSGQPAELREAITQMVSTALVEPALASLRESPFLAGPFAPGDAERRFGPLLDQHIADRVVTAANFPMIDTIVERYGRQAASSLPAGAGTAVKEHIDAAA